MGKAPETYREETNARHQAENWMAAFSQTEGLAEVTLPFLSPPLTEQQSRQVGSISETPPTRITLYPIQLIS